MKTFLKTLIGGALGLGALYVVGKVCFEAGKDVAEIERQLEQEKPAEKADMECTDEGTAEAPDLHGHAGYSAVQADPNRDEAKENPETTANETREKNDKPAFAGKIMDKIRNAKMFIRIKKSFEKGDRSPGILGSLLSNPDGAKIEAFVRNGGVQINVTPRAA